VYWGCRKHIDISIEKTNGWKAELHNAKELIIERVSKDFREEHNDVYHTLGSDIELIRRNVEKLRQENNRLQKAIDMIHEDQITTEYLANMTESIPKIMETYKEELRRMIIEEIDLSEMLARVDVEDLIDKILANIDKRIKERLGAEQGRMGKNKKEIEKRLAKDMMHRQFPVLPLITKAFPSVGEWVEDHPEGIIYLMGWFSKGRQMEVGGSQDPKIRQQVQVEMNAYKQQQAQAAQPQLPQQINVPAGADSNDMEVPSVQKDIQGKESVPDVSEALLRQALQAKERYEGGQ